MLEQEQVTTNKFACAFTPISESIEAHENLILYAISGYSANYDILHDFSKDINNDKYFEEKYKEAQDEITVMLKDVETHTSFPIFDESH